MIIYKPFTGQKPVKERIRETLHNLRNLLSPETIISNVIGNQFVFGNPNKDPMGVVKKYLAVQKKEAKLDASDFKLGHGLGELHHAIECQLGCAIDVIDNQFCNKKYNRTNEIIGLLEELVRLGDSGISAKAKEKLSQMQRQGEDVLA